MSEPRSSYELERSLARIGVRLLMPAIHLGNVVDRNRESWEALQRGEQYRPFEELADWWPKFVHRFIPAEEVWQRDSSTILREDQEAQAMFEEIIAARDALADCIEEARSNPTSAPLYPELFEPTEVLDAKLTAFYEMAGRRSGGVGRMKWWRGSVWAQERKAWQAPEAEWRASGSHSPGYGWNS
jgi:hypothetical protein